jgi:uncharacterized protein (TIGR02266 family)
MSDDASGGEERRDHPRTRVTLKVEYPSVEGFLQDYTINLSRGGTMLRTHRHLQMGDSVELVLSFPGLLEPISIEGEVRWVRLEGLDEQTVGVAFDLERAEIKETLEALVEALRHGDPRVVAPTIRILVVEDNPYVARLIRDGLAAYQQRTGDHTTFSTDHAKDGKEALQRMEGEGVDLLIVDIYLPVMDGASLIRMLRGEDRWKDLPIIAVSAGAQEAKQMALKAGADFFLDKPFRLSDVLDTMRRLLTSSGGLRRPFPHEPDARSD